MKIRLNTLIPDLPGHVYHSVPGTYSSSQLKDILDDEELFFKKYIEKSIKRESSSAFDVGTYFHTGVLEPEKIHSECAVFSGAVRRGKEYEAFCESNAGKCIVTSREKTVAEGLIHAVDQSPIATDVLSTCKPEVSLFAKVWVYKGRIYTLKKGDWRIHKSHGWDYTEDMTNWKAQMTPLLLKVRADALDIKGEHIVDLKSTTGNAKNERTIRGKISAYKYDLSASLYLDLFSLAFNSPVEAFYWTFASKDYLNSRTWLASDDNVRVGRAKWSKAVVKLAECISQNWKIPDCLGIAVPEFYEREWIS